MPSEKHKAASRTDLGPHVFSLTPFELRIFADDAQTRTVLKRLGARCDWLQRSLWSLRCYGDDSQTLAAKFKALSDAGVGFADNTRDDLTPASRFDELIRDGFLDGVFRRV
jgi:hypothetical protein